jgi:hypothetical protein
MDACGSETPRLAKLLVGRGRPESGSGDEERQDCSLREGRILGWRGNSGRPSPSGERGKRWLKCSTVRMELQRVDWAQSRGFDSACTAVTTPGSAGIMTRPFPTRPIGGTARLFPSATLHRTASFHSRAV